MRAKTALVWTGLQGGGRGAPGAPQLQLVLWGGGPAAEPLVLRRSSRRKLETGGHSLRGTQGGWASLSLLPW